MVEREAGRAGGISGERLDVVESHELDAEADRVELRPLVRAARPLVAGPQKCERAREAHQHSSLGTGTGTGMLGAGGAGTWPGTSGGPWTTVISASSTTS